MNIDNVSLQFSTNCNYILTIDKYPDLPLYVTSIAMPEVMLGMIEFGTPFNTIKTAGTSLTYGDIILTLFVDDELKNYKVLLAWMHELKELNSNDNIELMSNKMRKLTSNKYSNCNVTILNNKKDPVLNILFEDCFPSSLSGLLLTSNAQQEYNTCDLTLTFTKFEFKD